MCIDDRLHGFLVSSTCESSTFSLVATAILVSGGFYVEVFPSMGLLVSAKQKVPGATLTHVKNAVQHGG